MNQIKVILADDHPALRIGLRVLLDASPSISVVGEVENGVFVVQMISQLLPDIVILECQLPGIDGVKVAEELRKSAVNVKILALSAYDDDQYLAGMMFAGAAGYILKNEAPKQIVDAVERLYKGEILWTADQKKRVEQWQNEIGRIKDNLTARELEVLRFVALSLSNKEIAQKLSITVRTVDFHVSNILRKLGAISRVEAAVWAENYL